MTCGIDRRNRFKSIRHVGKGSVSLVARERNQGDSFWARRDHYRFKVASEETMGAVAVVEITAFPQNGPRPHIHHREHESFYIVEGTFSVVVGNRSFEAKTGACVHIPKDTLHIYKNIG